MTESNETVELTEQDKADLAALHAEPSASEEQPVFRPLLRIWQEILSNAPAAALEKVSPQWASRMIGTYQELKYADCLALQSYYFAKIAKMTEILQDVIDSDENCLAYTTPEEDLAENNQNYKTLLLEWQLQLLRWELAWDCTASDAAVEIAATAEVHSQFFGETGLTAFLDNIQFEFGEADQQIVLDAFAELRAQAVNSE